MLALKLFSAVALAAHALGQQQQMVRGPFNATAYGELMRCVGNASVSTRYHIAVHEGAVVIIPPEGGVIDLDGEADSALGSCLERLSPYLALAVDDSRANIEDAGAGAVTTTQELATAGWAESNGAQGITLQDGTWVSARTLGVPAALLARQTVKNYFFSLGSKYKDCSHYDQQNAVLNECINYKKSYKSIVFSNPNLYNSIRVRYWPHHLCAQDYSPPGKDGRSVVVPPSADTTCLKDLKDIFSYAGRVLPAGCVGTCQ